jgi:hypothetical protein
MLSENYAYFCSSPKGASFVNSILAVAHGDRWTIPLCVCVWGVVGYHIRDSDMITEALSYTHVQFGEVSHWFRLSVSWLAFQGKNGCVALWKTKGLYLWTLLVEASCPVTLVNFFVCLWAVVSFLGFTDNDIQPFGPCKENPSVLANSRGQSCTAVYSVLI